MSRKNGFTAALLALSAVALVGFSDPRQGSGQTFGLDPAFWLALLVIVVALAALAWWALRRPYRPGLPSASGQTPHEPPTEPAHAERAAGAAQEREPETEAERAAEATPPPAPPGEPDDLQRIEGIGPKVASGLQGLGITTFAQLADADPQQLEDALREAGVRILAGAPATWPEQARLAAAGDWEGLERLQSQLKGGRRA